MKPRYNALEKALWLVTQARVWIAAASQIYVIIIIFIKQEEFFYVAMIQGAIMLFLMILSL